MNVYCSIVVEAIRFPFRVIAFGFYWTFVLLPNGKAIDYDDDDDELDSDASSALKIHNGGRSSACQKGIYYILPSFFYSSFSFVLPN